MDEILDEDWLCEIVGLIRFWIISALLHVFVIYNKFEHSFINKCLNYR